MSTRRALTLFAVALALRLVYVAEIRSLPWFDVPIVDGANYLRLARAIAGGDLLGGAGAFWQPPLYPYFLALLLRLFGERMAWVYIVQSILGAFSCVLVYDIGRRIFGPRAATAAALITAFHAPLIHFDAQPLIPVLHIFLALAGIALLLRTGRAGALGGDEAGGGGEGGPMRRGGAAGFSLPGLMWGLAAIATPNILLVVPGASVWVWRRAAPPGATSRRARAAGVLWFLAGVALPVGLVAGRNLAVAREPVLISSNGGINFYIGNNADYERAVRIRPGGEFQRLAQEPENAGVVGAAAQSRWFAARAAEFLTRYPGSALRLYLRKARDLAAGREIPRNDSMYDYRRRSWLLSALLWRRLISFPFGLLAPLALAGLAVAADEGSSAEAGGGREARRSGRALLLLYAGAYACSVLIFFPTDRYRLPIVPVLALFAGRLLGSPLAVWKRAAVVLTLVAGLVMFNLDAFTPGESWPEEEALNRAYALRVQGRTEEARREYQRAIDLNPGRIDPYNSLAVMAAEDGDWEETVWRYRELLAVAPDFVEVRCSLAQALVALGRKEEARHEWETAVYLVPAAGQALADLALSYLEDGQPEAALAYARRSVRARPDLAETHFALGMTARALRLRDEALRELGEAVRLFPQGSPGRRLSEEVLEKMRRRTG